MPMASAGSKVEPLEHNADLGIYLQQTNFDGESPREFYYAQFNPRQNLLATAGNSYKAQLWDLRKDDFLELKPKEIPHIKGPSEDKSETQVSSIHWNQAGDKLLTSSSDQLARVWKVDGEGEVTISKCKNFNQYLM